MNHGFIVYLKDLQRKGVRANKQNVLAVAQTAKEGREVKDAALVNSR